MTSLSVIIPCYNCERTLGDAVAPVFRQDSPIPFDVTLVDDGSTDGTIALMERLAAEHQEIRIVRHPSNLGGGAARNTAVASSDGELIFCLDSDDMLGADFLRHMVGLWEQKKCDGIGIGTSIKFKGTKIDDVAYVTQFSRPGLCVPFDALLDGSECSLMSTFLITRPAFDRIRGYPTAHGFDTQGIAWRFLANGLLAYTCPEAVYHHRVQFHRSYFIREDRAGRYNWNWFLILSEFLYLFNDETKALILNKDLVPDGQPTLEQDLRTAVAAGRIYVDNHAELIHMGREGVAIALCDSPNMYDQYWLGEYSLSVGQPAAASHHFEKALRAGFPHWIIHCRMTQAALQQTGASISARFSLGSIRVDANGRGLAFEAIIPPLSAYQRLENWLLLGGAFHWLGRSLKSIRLSLKRARSLR